MYDPGMKLTSTGWSILGFLSLQDRNGYEIRQAARRSVEQFWGVSDGQLYPQLRHLSGLGLIEQVESNPSSVTGAAITWSLTEEGRSALRNWLRSPSAPTRARERTVGITRGLPPYFSTAFTPSGPTAPIFAPE